MIYEKFKIPIIVFIDRCGEIPNLVGAVLFGSALTGDISKKSDIDILLVFDCDHNPEIGDEMKISRHIASEIALKENMGHSFSFTFVNKKKLKETEPDFLWNVVNEGILIWGKPKDVLSRRSHPALEPLVMFKYSVKSLSGDKRRKLLRQLYSSKKKLIDKKDERIGPGTLLFKAKKFNEIKKIFDDIGLKSYSFRKLWGH